MAANFIPAPDFDLHEAYRTPGHSFAFSGVNQLIPHTKNPADFLSEIDSYTRHRFVAKPRRRNPIYVYNKRELIQVDLADVQHLAKHNKNVRFLLLAIDTFSRKLWIRPLKTKTTAEVARNMRSILNVITPPAVKRIFSDRGLEFTGAAFVNLLNEYNIKITLSNDEVKCPHVERVTKTLKDLMYRYMTDKETYQYLPALNDLLETYNSRIHRAHKMSPNDADMDENRMQVINELNKNFYQKALFTKVKAHPKLNIGDTVRLQIVRETFRKGYEETFTGEIFKIGKIYDNLPHVQYGVTTYDGNEEIEGRFYPSQLQKVHHNNVFKVEKVLERKRIRNVPYLKVKWLHFNDSYNSWIPESDVVEKYQK